MTETVLNVAAVVLAALLLWIGRHIARFSTRIAALPAALDRITDELRAGLAIVREFDARITHLEHHTGVKK